MGAPMTSTKIEPPLDLAVHQYAKAIRESEPVFERIKRENLMDELELVFATRFMERKADYLYFNLENSEAWNIFKIDTDISVWHTMRLDEERLNRVLCWPLFPIPTLVSPGQRPMREIILDIDPDAEKIVDSMISQGLVWINGVETRAPYGVWAPKTGDIIQIGPRAAHKLVVAPSSIDRYAEASG